MKQLPKPPAGPTAPPPSAWPSLGAHWVLGIEPGLSGGAAGAAGLKVVTPASVSSPASWMSADYLASEILPPPFVRALVSSVTQPALQAAESPFQPPPAHSHVGGVTGGGRRQSSPGWSAEVLTGRSGRAGEAACSVGLRSCGSPRTLRCRITHSVGVSGGGGPGRALEGSVARPGGGSRTAESKRQKEFLAASNLKQTNKQCGKERRNARNAAIPPRGWGPGPASSSPGPAEGWRPPPAHPGSPQPLRSTRQPRKLLTTLEKQLKLP